MDASSLTADRKYSLFRVSFQTSVKCHARSFSIGSLSNDYGDGNENGNKAIGLH